MATAAKVASGGMSPWPVEPLGSLGRWVGGGTPSKAEPSFWTNGTVPWVSAKDMKTAVIDRTADLITDEAVMRSAAKRIPAGSVLCVMRSGILAHTFPVAVSAVEVTINQDLRALVVRGGVDPHYLANFLRFSGSEILLTCSKHGTTVSSVEASRLNRFPVPLPPLETQQRIVSRINELFSELDDGEEELRRARADLKAYRKSLLKAAVTGELTADWRAANPVNHTTQALLDEIRVARIGHAQAARRGRRAAADTLPADTDELPTLPDAWAWTTVGSLGDVSGGVTKNAKRSTLPLLLPYLRVANVGAGSLDLERVESIGLSPGEVERVTLKKGDLLIVEGNGSIDQIGRSAIWDGQIEPCVHQNHLIKVRFGDERLARWTQLWLRSPHGRRELEVKASSTSGLHTLSIGKIENVRCPLPPLAELSRLLDLTEDALAAAGTTDHDVAELSGNSAALRQSILAAAFRGELVT